MRNDNPLGLGATGNYPLGKLNESDEGELRAAIKGDPERKIVLINFGKPVEWAYVSPEGAEVIGNAFLECAKRARGETE